MRLKTPAFSLSLYVNAFPIDDAMNHEYDSQHVKFNTLHINLYGIPGTGKSGVARGVAQLLGRAGYDVELVQEYARELARDGRLIFMDPQTGERREADQFVISAEQYRRQASYDGKVQVVVTDSGLFTGVLFSPEIYRESMRTILRELTIGWDSVDVLLERDISKDYTSLGRVQSREESEALRPELVTLLEVERPEFIRLPVDGADEKIYRAVVEILGPPAPRRKNPIRP
jgi:hypothetical protein